MNRYTVIGISLPKTIVKKIDYVRGDINRSRWILRALESLMETIENKKPQSPQVSRPMETEDNIASTGVDTGRH